MKEPPPSSSPLPSPFNLFFCFRSNFRAITRLETLATQAIAWVASVRSRASSWRQKIYLGQYNNVPQTNLAKVNEDQNA